MIKNEGAPSYCELSDEQLLALIVQKDQGALAALYDRHAQTVFQVLLRIVHDTATAEDLLQESFWLVWQKAHQYYGGGAVAAWLFRVARNKAIDQLRWQKHRPQSAVSFGELETLTNKTPSTVALRPVTVEHEVEQRWVGWQVQQAMQRLPGEQRACLELAYFQGLSQSEIAEQTHTPLGTIKTRMRIGMEKLGRILYNTGQTVGVN